MNKHEIYRKAINKIRKEAQEAQVHFEKEIVDKSKDQPTSGRVI